jgi:hypothetical protein
MRNALRFRPTLAPGDVLAHPYLGTGANFIDDGDFVIFYQLGIPRVRLRVFRLAI